MNALKNAGIVFGSNMDKPKQLYHVFKPNNWVCPHSTQTWVVTTEHFFKSLCFIYFANFMFNC